jgi:hypothetical protein
MPYTTPRTWVAAEIATAANLNTHLRDNVAWMATDSPACRAYNNANISIPNAVAAPGTAITLNSERFDNAAVHSTAVNTSRLTVPSGAAGKYIMGLGTSWAGSAGGNYRQSRIELNGATTNIGIDTRNGSGGHLSEAAWSTVYALAVADYIEGYARQDSGGALNTLVQANSTPEFWCFWFRT